MQRLINVVRTFGWFFGRQGAKYLAAGVVVGICVFVIEFLFAFTLQVFLKTTGVLNSDAIRTPEWFPVLSAGQTLGFIILLGFLRCGVLWAQGYLHSSAFEVERAHQRRRLVRWAFRSDNVSSGYLMTLFTDLAQAVGTFFTEVQMVAILLPTSMFLWAGLMSMAPMVTLGATATLLVVGLGIRSLNGKIARLGDAYVHELSSIHERILVNIRNLLLMQIYGTGPREEKHVEAALDRAMGSNFRYQVLLGLKYVVPQFFGIVIICAITAVSMEYHLLEQGLILSYFYLFLRFSQGFAEAVKHASSLMFHWPQARTMMDWWLVHGRYGRLTPEETQRLLAPPLGRAAGWQLDQISFRYAEADRDVLSNLSLRIEPGELFAIVGPSGVGKSTLIYLLLGLQEPRSGGIRLLKAGDAESKPLAELRSNLLASVGYVGPDSFIFDGTVRENLMYGLEKEPDETLLREALRLAQCQFILTMPKGLEHRLSEQGHGLSAGQKQRLSLARALLRKPSVLILDEATSNLDAQTESELIEALLELKGAVTIVAVTHRGSLVQVADRVLTLSSEGFQLK